MNRSAATGPALFHTTLFPLKRSRRRMIYSMAYSGSITRCTDQGWAGLGMPSSLVSSLTRCPPVGLGFRYLLLLLPFLLLLYSPVL